MGHSCRRRRGSPNRDPGRPSLLRGYRRLGKDRIDDDGNIKGRRRLRLPGSLRKEDLLISIQVRNGRPNIVAENTGDECYRLLRGWHLRVEDRAGHPLAEWDDIRLLVDGVLPAGAERSFELALEPTPCDSSGPYLVSATVGPYFARLGHLSGNAIACIESVATKTRQQIERIGNRWAVVFG